MKKRFLRWYNHIRDRKDKSNRCWARERKNVFQHQIQVGTPQCIKKKISSTGQNRSKSAKISCFGQNYEYLTKFQLYEESQKKPRMNEMKRLPWSIPKSHTRLSRIKLELNERPDPYFCPYSRRYVEFVEKKKACQIPRALEFVVTFFVWKPQDLLIGTLDSRIHVFAN